MNTQVTIGEVSLNATHFAGKTESDAVKAMIADGITSEEAWARKAYKACQEAVKKPEKPKNTPVKTPEVSKGG